MTPIKWNFLALITVLCPPLIGWSKVCPVSINKKSVEIQWTGYKFTEKAGVSGTFKEWSFVQTPDRKLKNLLTSLQFRVNLMSLESGVSSRNNNITSSLFENLAGDSHAWGRILSYNAKTKKAQVRLQFNNSSLTLPFNVVVDKDTLTATGKLNLLSPDIKMSGFFETLKKTCEKLHVGKDGKSVSWPEVDLKIVAELERNC